MVDLNKRMSQEKKNAKFTVISLPASSKNAASAAPQKMQTKNAQYLDNLLSFFHKFYIDPFENFYYAWLIIVSLAFVFNLVFLIARSSFWLLQEIDHPLIWLLVDYLICDLIYILDFLMRLFTGYMERGEICTEKAKIFKKYFHSIQFKLDILSILPTDFFYFLFKQKSIGYRFLPALRLNRLLKFPRLTEFRTITETKTKYPTVFRMSNLLINILLGMHWNACIYFIVSNLIGFGNDTWVYPNITTNEFVRNLTETEINNRLLTHRLDVQYIYCFWWSVLTLTTIAEVQPPCAFYQEFYMSVLIMIGVVILAITIGSAGDMVENANRHALELQTKCDYAKSFLQQNRITGELELRIKSYLDYLWLSPDVSSGDVLDTLPYNLRKEIAMNVHMETFKRVAVFQDCEPGLLEELVTKLKLEIYSPGDYVCRKGDVGHEMYFIKTGMLQVVSPDGKQVYATLGPGAAFGEISILDIPGNKNGNKRTANIRSVGFSDVFQLSKTDLWDALSEYPLAKKTLIEKGKALLRKDNLLDEELAEKIERKHKPLFEQADYFKSKSLVKLDAKLDEFNKKFSEFFNETNLVLDKIEHRIPIIK